MLKSHKTIAHDTSRADACSYRPDRVHARGLVRRDSTFLLKHQFYEAPPHLAGKQIEVRFDPLDLIGFKKTPGITNDRSDTLFASSLLSTWFLRFLRLTARLLTGPSSESSPPSRSKTALGPTSLARA